MIENLQPQKVFYYFKRFAVFHMAPEIPEKSVIIWWILQTDTTFAAVRMNQEM